MSIENAGYWIFGMVAFVAILGVVVLFILSEWSVTSALYKEYPVVFVLSVSNAALAILLRRKWGKFYDTFINERKQMETAINKLACLRNKEKELIDRENKIKSVEDENQKRECYIREILSAHQPLKVVSTLYSDILTSLYCDSLISYLTFKQRPAMVAAQHVKEIKKELKAELAKYKLYQYKYETIESFYPEVEELFDDDEIDEEVIQDIDKEIPQKWVENCTSTDENERAQYFLDCYMKSHNKTNWEIGRDYETFVAWKFFNKKQSDGVTPKYRVIQEGCNKKLEDRGRDVIAINRATGKVYIIQCKMWSKGKLIHEKHIFQLYGSALDYVIRNNLRLADVVPVFVTTIQLSDYAKTCAKLLNVTIREDLEMGEYAPIKLNINEQTGEKIYHLPFDQQYDNVKIENDGEGYAKTVAEAVKLGFRRAHRYSFNS